MNGSHDFGGHGTVVSMMIAMAACIALPSANAETIVLKGKVGARDGSTLAARVSILRGPPRTGIETHDTAGDGTFQIETDDRGIVAISAGAPGYASDEVQRTGDSRFPRLDFTLTKMQELQGRVRDRSGRPLAGVRVQVRYVDIRRHLQLDDGAAGETDATGSFVLAAGIGPGTRAVIDALPDDWVPQSSAVLGTGAIGSTGGGEDSGFGNILIELQQQGGRVQGRVTSPGGDGLANVLVHALVKVSYPRAVEGDTDGLAASPGGPERPFGNAFRKRVRTNSSGSYTIAGLPPGDLAVVAVRRGRRIPVQRHSLAEGRTVTADFVMPN